MTNQSPIVAFHCDEPLRGRAGYDGLCPCCDTMQTVPDAEDRIYGTRVA